MRLFLGGHLNFYNRDHGYWTDVTLKQPTRLKEILLSQAIPLGEIQLVVINGELLNLDTVVSNEDEVKLFSAVGGG